MKNAQRFLFLSAILVLVSGCSDPQAQKDAVIKGMIKGGSSVRSQVLNDSAGILSDMKVYRDGDKDGVVFEYVYAKGVDVDRSKLSSESIKSMMMPQLKGDEDVKVAFDMDIYVKVMYKSAEGEILGQATLTKADF